MKKYLLWIAAAFVAEVAILLIGTAAALDRPTLMLAMAVLPAMLFIAAIFMIVRSVVSSPSDEKDKTKDGSK